MIKDPETFNSLCKMPEIAEVRIMADNIDGFLTGNEITHIELMHPEILVKYSNKNLKGLSEFNMYLKDNNGCKVSSVNTRGKFCWLELENSSEENGWNIMIRFGMSGNIRIEPTDEYLHLYNKNLVLLGKKTITRDEYLKHCHLKIHYFNPIKQTLDHFYYHDIRRFGSWTFTKDQLSLQKHLKKLGHDPLNESELTESSAISLFRRFNHQNICKALMSQELIAGVGNYITSEVLYECGIHPLSIIKNIPDVHLYLLYQSVRNIAQDAYNAGGASLYTYSGIQGDRSDFKSTLKVYGKTHDPFGRIVERISDKESPDKRSKYWVKEVQTIGFTQKKKIIIKKLIL